MLRALPIALVVLTTAARADIAPTPLNATGSTLRPVDENAAHGVGMTAETVEITVGATSAVIDATFTMSKAKAATTFAVGFPGEGVPAGGFFVHAALEHFEAWVDGKKVDALAKQITRRNSEPAGFHKTRVETWHQFPASFSATAQTTIRVRYEVKVSVHQDTARVWYILATGALWAGPIGIAKVAVRAAPGSGVTQLQLYQGGSRGGLFGGQRGDGKKVGLPVDGGLAGTEVRWERANFEPGPEDDLTVTFILPAQ